MITRQSAGRYPDFSGGTEFYGFGDPPFSLVSDSRFFYESHAHRAALDALTDSLASRQPFTIVTGAHGSGKTMVCRTLLDRLDGRVFASYVPTPVASFAELLQRMLIDFGVVSKEAADAGRLADESTYRLLGVLHDSLLSLRSVGATAALLIDEAQHVPDDLVEQLRLLSNLEADDAALLPIVLVGRPDLLDRFGGDEAVTQDRRVFRRAELLPLTRHDLDGYIAHCVAVSEPRSPVTFHRRAIDAIYAFTSGSPRLVNQLCDRSLVIGADQRSAVITLGVIEQAASVLTLRQPSPDSSRWSWRRLAASGLLGS